MRPFDIEGDFQCPEVVILLARAVIWWRWRSRRGPLDFEDIKARRDSGRTVPRRNSLLLKMSPSMTSSYRATSTVRRIVLGVTTSANKGL